MTPDLNVVLVRTMYPSNIGSSARALANMGGKRLILVNPKCELASSKAKQGAAGAQETLRETISYPDWNSFYAAEGTGLRIAMTRRGGKKRTLFPIREALKKYRARNPKTQPPIYFYFGPEDDGLDSDDIAFANMCCNLPTFGEFASLNLSQAVLLTLFIAQDYFSSVKSAPRVGPKLAKSKPLFFPDQTIKDWLEAIGFSLKARRASAYLTFRKLLLQNQPTETELHVIEAILQQNIRKLGEAKESKMRGQKI